MLTKAHRVYRWIRPGSSISSDRLEADCLPPLERAIAVYRSGLGRTLGEVRNAARRALERVRPDRVEAVVDLLDQAADYEWPSARAQGDRRVRLFERAAREHPVLDPARAGTLLTAALDPPPGGPEAAGARLYGDYPEFHRLRAFPADYTARDLRADYDLAQAQALLYSALRVTVAARADFKHILQYARLSRLLWRVEPLPDGGYRLAFDGPTSLLRRTHQYGVDFARFLAALVQARGWRLTADIALRKDRPPVVFALTEADGLRSRVPPPRLFDSRLEEGPGPQVRCRAAGLAPGPRGRHPGGRRRHPGSRLRLHPRRRHPGRARDRGLLDAGVPPGEAGPARPGARGEPPGGRP